MIHAVAWFCASHCGIWTPDGTRARQQRAPVLTAADDVAALVGHPVKFFSRMTPEAQMSVCAAALALQGAPWPQEPALPEIGVLAAGYDGCLALDADYFADYVASGRKLGRASLFVYTLPTSAACAVSMALGLTGPTLHLHEDGGALPAAACHAAQMVTEGQAAGMLVLWSDPHAAICLAVGAGEQIPVPPLLQATPDPSPMRIAHDFHAIIPSS
jgi:3-oxoacyl-(acyl-carrier-protein) synthase